MRGEAFAEAKAQRRRLERASPIFVNDLVGTGPDSRLWLRLGGETSIQLGERARLLIERFLINAGGEITLEAGAMFFEKRAPERPTAMKVQTSYGLIEVRGTRFFAGLSNKVFGVFVEEGAVTVTASGRQVIVSAGEGVDIARPGAPPTAPRQWGKPRIDAAYASVR
jgi:ferric-dicitrate binding protein FerR (iron transport regulator)